jgi:hypothetical protein
MFTALVLLYLRPTKVVIMVGMVGVLLWGVVAVTGTIDQFRYTLSVVETRDWLLHRGGRRRIHRCRLCPEWLVALCSSSNRAAQTLAGARCVLGHQFVCPTVQDCECPGTLVCRGPELSPGHAVGASDTIYVLEHTVVREHWGSLPCGRRSRKSPSETVTPG